VSVSLNDVPVYQTSIQPFLYVQHALYHCSCGIHCALPSV